jgi:hypothetical protein
MRHPNKRGNSSQECRSAKGACIVDGQRGMFEINEQRMKARQSCKLDDGW